MNKRFTTAFILVCLALVTNAQHVQFAQSIIDTLCTPYFSGRGYVNDGDRRASTFIANEFKSIGLQTLKDDTYFHDFKLNVNTFPGTVAIERNGEELLPGFDYIIAPNAPTTKSGKLTVHLVSKSLLMNKKRYKKLLKLNWENNVLLIDTITHSKKSKKRFDKLIKKYKNPITLHTQKKLTWSVSRNQNSQVSVHFLPGVLKQDDEITINIEAKFIEGYESRNVLGIIRGSEEPDSFIFITGHYDHLGMMGLNCIMPGANDNASGIAMILDFAKYFKNNPPRYSVVFVAFAAEEAGLVGSYHLVNELSSYVDPSKIRFVVNMDLMGSGQEGIMAVNGAILPQDFQTLSDINTAKNYLPQVKKRGKAANSDHYFFTESGIPAFFFYLMGPYSHYHDLEDTSVNLRLEEKAYNGSFQLIRDFMKSLMGDAG
jgi:aminopeptidase YwaD